MSFQNPVFIPGPTNIPEEVRKACDMPTIDHRSPLFGQILHPARAGVQKVLKSKSAEVFIFPASGTGGWETALTNTLSAGDKVLVARNGMFSHRWIDMCQRHGLDVEIVETRWGDGISAARYGDILAADKTGEIKAVLATHNETATGVRSDIGAIRREMDTAGHGALLFVDGVSSIGSMDFRFDEWGVDVAVTGSQKGFMLPAGLAIVGFSQKAMEATKTAGLPRTFFDVSDMAKGYENSAYPYTPSVGLMNGLKLTCDMLLTEGLDNVFARHHRLAEGVRRAVSAWGLELCASSPEVYSDTVSAILTPEGFNATSIVTHAADKYGVAFGVGLGEVAGKLFRIGHLGSLTDVMALSGIATAEMCMVDLGLEIQLGSGVAAAQDYYRNSVSVEHKDARVMKDIADMYIPTYQDMLDAHERIRPYVHRTPVLTSSYLNELTGAELFFKCENFQKAAAFKVRGASNAVFGLSDADAARGVATHSSGNHALSLSYAAGRRGIPCHVVMPRTAPQAKKDAVIGYGGKITECEPSTSSREAVFEEVQAATGADFVHPYNDPRVIAGQGTCSRELVEQVEGLDAVVAPIGGGGMVSGTCLTLSTLAPEVKIYAAEPDQADDAARSFRAGHIIADDAPVTVADGLKVPLKELTWHFVSNHVTDILTASEQEIVDAMRMIWARMKIVMEPSSAVPLATILKNPDVFAGKRVGVIVTGGNVDLDKLPWMQG